MDIDVAKDRLQELLQRELSPEEAAEILMWERGRKLVNLVQFDGFEIILELLLEYVKEYASDLYDVDPKDKDLAYTKFVASQTAREINRRLNQDLKDAINASVQTPVVMKEAYRTIRTDVPPDGI